MDEQFLQEPTLAFLESHQNHLRVSSATEIYVLSLSKLKLSSIGDIGQFNHLQICDLSSNFIESIESLLLNCRQLIKLDLHSNRISKLPDGQLWQDMLKLKILYLHDNLLSSYDDIKCLSYTPTLDILTLYDSPLSLKKNYRHHVVNSIWTLKALDTYVVADDEIIEKTHFHKPFTACTNTFKLNLYIPTSKDGTSKTECQAINQLYKQINRIQSHCCPVLILQKNFRMWLVHLRLKKLVLSKQKPIPGFLRRRIYSPGAVSSSRVSLYPKQSRVSLFTDPISQTEFNKPPEPVQNKRHIRIQMNQIINSQTDRVSSAKQTSTKKGASKSSNADETTSILCGKKSELVVYEPVEELNDEIRAARQYVQAIKDESHLKQRKRIEEIKEHNTANRQPIKYQTADDRLLRTIHGSMALGCLVAIDKAYNDRAKIERRKYLVQDVEQIRQDHSLNNAYVQHINDERLAAIHRVKDQDRKKQVYNRHRLDHAQNDLHDTVQEHRLQLLEQQEKRRAQIAFSQGFNAQHISISNALKHHENNIRNQRKARQARESVTRKKQNAEEQARVIEKYLTQRKHVRRALSNIERKHLDIQAMQDASDRLLQAQQRVAHIRARDSNIRQFGVLKMIPHTDDTRQPKTQSLAESMAERESLFDTITDHMAAQQIVQ
ncbi:unnamed protein product [Adineta ricciae]|uniref:Leucine-rich repeat and IQ domain-containing protein 3 n=1 Tax=Adineta ricciae TaxID=249248 RepID=A0A816DKI6_ADIRI|nr:unnamed protein product [Adineta ricciae]